MRPHASGRTTNSLENHWWLTVRFQIGSPSEAIPLTDSHDYAQVDLFVGDAGQSGAVRRRNTFALTFVSPIMALRRLRQ